jgi:hypothetical protein
LSPGDQAVETRQVAITLTGCLINQCGPDYGDLDTVSKTLTGIVKVRNDRVFIQP